MFKICFVLFCFEEGGSWKIVVEKLGEDLDQGKSWLNNMILITLGEGRGLKRYERKELKTMLKLSRESSHLERCLSESSVGLQFAVFDLFRNPELRRPLFICLVLQLAQQFSGINAVSVQQTSHGIPLRLVILLTLSLPSDQ